MTLINKILTAWINVNNAENLRHAARALTNVSRSLQWRFSFRCRNYNKNGACLFIFKMPSVLFNTSFDVVFIYSRRRCTITQSTTATIKPSQLDISHTNSRNILCYVSFLRNVLICSLDHTYWQDVQINENRMGKECSTHRSDDESLQIPRRKPWKKETSWKTTM